MTAYTLFPPGHEPTPPAKRHVMPCSQDTIATRYDVRMTTTGQRGPTHPAPVPESDMEQTSASGAHRNIFISTTLGNHSFLVPARRLTVLDYEFMAQTASPTDGEAAVRSYLTFLSDPDSLIDVKAVKELETAVEKAKDPLDKLRAVGALHQARSMDTDVYRKRFVASGKAWADAEGVPANAFEQMGVPHDALVEAGIIIVGGRPRGGARAKATTTGTRRPAVKAEDLESGILSLKDVFSVREVAERIGGSPVSVKALLGRLEAEGKVTPAGERASHRGRAAQVWKVAV
jgi:hypothetical protein